jgi:CRP-like cAMP-binding protein
LPKRKFLKINILLPIGFRILLFALQDSIASKFKRFYCWNCDEASILGLVSCVMDYALDLKEHRPISQISRLSAVSQSSLIDAVEPWVSLLRDVELQTFDLGEEILSFKGSATELTDQSMLYLVGRGAVRVLCTTDSRQVTAELLEPGASFGLDDLFCHHLLAYDVIAATPCQVARIPAQKLLVLLNRVPALRQQIVQQVQQRQRLIFFRSLTSFCSVASLQLKSLLLPQLVEQQVFAGTLLKQLAVGHSGQFWLRSGEISSSQGKVPTVGESWRWLEQAAIDWVAQTDLVLYEMPLEWLGVATRLGVL